MVNWSPSGVNKPSLPSGRRPEGLRGPESPTSDTDTIIVSDCLICFQQAEQQVTSLLRHNDRPRVDSNYYNTLCKTWLLSMDTIR